MKNANILTESERSEMRAFMRAESPLVSFARSCRGDASNSDDPNAALEKDKGDNKTASILEGIDLEELPEAARALLVERDKAFATLQTEKTTLQKENIATQKLAKDHQSRADRNHALLQKHNLVEGQQQQQQQQLSPQDQLQQTMLAQLMKDGMSEATALPYAKMLAGASAVTVASIEQRLGGFLNPLAQQVGNLASDRVLEKAISEDKEGILDIPEVRAEVLKDIADLNAQGTAISIQTVNNLTNMALGNYMRKNPGKALPTPQTVNIQTRQGFPGSGFSPRLPNTRVTGDKPAAINSETQAASDNVFAKMTAGLLPKKGGK